MRVSAEPAVCDPPAERSSCFHCGLDITGNEPPPGLPVLGEERAFCCTGCQQVCKAIVEAGLEDYYRHRSHPDARAQQGDLKEVLERLAVFDRPEVQGGFVRELGPWREASLLLEDIRCPACLWLNERQLRRQAGVLDVSIDSATQRMRVRWDPRLVRLSEILRAIAEIGYLAHPYDAAHSERLGQARRRRSIERLIFAGVLGMAVMHFSIASYVMGAPNASGALPLWVAIGRWTSLLVCLTLLAYPAQDFWVGAWQDLRNRRLGMDVPIALALALAFLGSLQATVTGHGEVYFDSIAMFVFFVLLARHWETRGRIRAADRLDRLSTAVPSMAWRKTSEPDDWQSVAVMDLAPGDLVRVLPGERTPVDGLIVQGRSSFDESLLTGESDPVLRGPGDKVVAGAVNGDQRVIIRVVEAGVGTAIERIRHLVDQGLAQRPRSAELTARVAVGIVAAVLLSAAGTALIGWQVAPEHWLERTIAVLMVTCPCALALATPVALAACAGHLVALGVLPLRMEALDTLAQADTLAFDKTGTLTLGHPTLTAVRTPGALSDAQALRIAASLAELSEHPLAKSTRAAWPGTRLPVEDGENAPGGGVTGAIAGERWAFGKPDFVAGALRRPAWDPIPADLAGESDSISTLGDSRGAQAWLAFVDALRPGARELVPALRDLGVDRVVMLSGDNRRSVGRLAAELGLSGAESELLPQDKLAWVRARQAEGHRVVMVGDGINDAPTLAAADASVSLASATDLAAASSDFLLLNDQLSALAPAIGLARRTKRIVRENLAWAAAYNLLAIPMAAAGLIPPWAAALGMSASSLLVVANALRLQRGEPQAEPAA